MSHLSSGPKADCDRFQTTHWSLVVSAGDRKSARSDEALARLCADYWPPIYAYIRRSGHSLHAAQDLTQEFFARLLEKNYVQSADRARGRFRSFLLGAVKHFLSNHRKAARAQKRGGGQPLLSLDFSSVEAAYQIEPADSQTPDHLFDQQWALLLLDRILQRLADEVAATGKAKQWELLREFLTAGADHRPYAQAAAELGTSEAAVKMTVHRMRKRYRQLLRDEIGQTVAEASEIDDEIRQLFAILARKPG
jgi:RNA polymerase sigma factor (sigma-70 family)